MKCDLIYTVWATGWSFSTFNDDGAGENDQNIIFAMIAMASDRSIEFIFNNSVFFQLSHND